MVWVVELGRNMYVHTYVCTYIVHTCFVLTNPPIRPRHVITWQKINLFLTSRERAHKGPPL